LLPKLLNPFAAKVILGIIALGFVLHSGAVFSGKDRRPEYGSGEKIAQRLLNDAAANNGVVSLAQFGKKACMYPPGVGLATGAAEWLFPQERVVFEEGDDSEGYWYLIVQEQNGVSIYAIAQASIHWTVIGTAIYRDLITCRSRLRIDASQNPPELSEFID
jgi:hypothetical protein